MTPANLVTVLRILFLPLLVWMFFSARELVVPGPMFYWFGPPAVPLYIWLFIILACTDFIDGLLARIFGTSRFGAVVDPIADKLLVAAALMLLATRYSHLDYSYLWVMVPMMLLLWRELVVTIMRESSDAATNVMFKSGWTAKWKTVAQGFAIGFLMYERSDYFFFGLGYTYYQWGILLLWVSVLLTYISFGFYIRQYLSMLRSRR